MRTQSAFDPRSRWSDQGDVIARSPRRCPVALHGPRLDYFHASLKLIPSSFEAFKAIHPGLFGQILVMRLFKYTNILTQICGNNFMVLKVAPPLTTSEEQMDYCSVIETVRSSKVFWTEALQLGRRAISS